MNARTLAALVLLNAVLLAAVIVTAFTPRSAEAQLGGGAEQYLMVAGTAQGLPQQDVVYVVNLTTGQVVMLSYNSGTDNLSIVAGRDLTRDLRGGGDAR